MQPSVPTTTDAQATFAATLFDEWFRHGLREVVICPGSRSTPLAVAALRHGGLRLHVRIDERSAGFFAIGRALALRSAVVVIVTSGTAAAELHAAVVEADLAEVPLVVLTADRPPELHGVGAPQTIEQRHLYGGAVRRFEEPGVARADVASAWRPLASRCWWAAMGIDGEPGPVHVNAAFVEPLLGVASALPRARDDSGPWRAATKVPLVSGGVDLRGRRVLAVVGRSVDAAMVEALGELGWAVIGDATVPATIPYFDALLRDTKFADVARPDIVVRLGALPASKVLAERLREWSAPIIAWRGAGRLNDPDGLIAFVRPGLPDVTDPQLRVTTTYRAWWTSAAANVARWLASRDGADRVPDEPAVARAVVAASSEHDVALVVGSSMPVRDVEWWATARSAPTFANRGANGIDGVVSTVLGVGAGGASIGLIGDLTFLHDVSGLVDGLGSAGGRCVLVVVQNGGGGIFSFLAQARALDDDDFELLFGTPRPHDVASVARSFGHHGESVTTMGALHRAIADGLGRDGLSVIAVRVGDRDDNVAVHAEYVAGVAEHWGVSEP